MRDESEDLGENLASVFSLVSSEEAIRSSREVIEAYGDAENAIAGTIKWAEFSLTDEFVRGGFSRTGTMGARVQRNPFESILWLTRRMPARRAYPR